MPTAVGTALSFLAAPIGGIGAIIVFFGAFGPAAIFMTAGVSMWLVGRWLISR